MPKNTNFVNTFCKEMCNMLNRPLIYQLTFFS